MEPPICSRCPACGDRTFLPVRSTKKIAYQNDRECLACGTRYGLPTPVWAAIMFIVMGIALSGVCILSTIIAVARGILTALPLNLVFAVLGIFCVIHGVRSMREDVAAAPDPAVKKGELQ